MRSSRDLAGSLGILLCVATLIALTACGGGHSSGNPNAVGSVTLSPSVVSLNLGDTIQMSATALSPSKQPITPTIFYASNTPNIVGMSPSGLVCAGHWDANFVNCTPGPVGVGQVIASAGGVASAPVKVYVHQRVDSVVINPTSVNCLSKSGTQTFTASALNNVLGDITSTVGQFNWQAVDAGVVLLNNAIQGLGLNQVVATANTPGKTQVFASISRVNSVPAQFVTCAVASLTTDLNNVAGQTTVTIGTTGTATVTSTSVDTNNAVIVAPLTFASTNLAVASVGPAGFIRAANPGTTTIVASCTPPSCNTNLNPVYSNNVLTVVVSGAPATFNVWATSRGCTGKPGCTTNLVPIATPANTLGTAISLPATPNSMLFDPQGKKAYLGSDSGLIVVDTTASPPAVTHQPAIVGKVIAISNDGSKVLISDTTSAPSNSYVFNTATSTATPLGIADVAAGTFSPDSLKAFAVNGNLTSPPAAPDLTVYSTLYPQNNLALTAGSNPLDVAFYPTGAFAYIADGVQNGVAVRATCDTSNTPNFISTVTPTPGTPALIGALPSGSEVLAVDVGSTATYMDVITPTNSTGTCPPTVTDALTISVPFGQLFTPTQLLIAPDSGKAYVLSSNLAEVLAFDVASNTVSSIPLRANAVPLTGIMRPDATNMFIGANDGTVHQINLPSQSDVGRISGLNLCSSACNADILAFQP